jgi:hypothetical protein
MITLSTEQQIYTVDAKVSKEEKVQFSLELGGLVGTAATPLPCRRQPNPGLHNANPR